MDLNISSVSWQLKVFELWQRVAGLFRPLEKEDNVVSVVYRLVKAYKLKISRSSIIDYLKSHNDYPSLKSICDFFNEFNVLNYAIRIEEQELFNLKRPFLAHINLSKGRVLMIYMVDRDTIIYADSLDGKKAIETKRFLEKWDGVVVLIDPTIDSGEKDFIKKRSNEIIDSSLVPLAVIIFCFIAFYFSETNVANPNPRSLKFIILMLAHLSGLLFSILLLKNELNLKTKFTEKLCHLSSLTDCDAVTRSNGSNIFGSITWADIGICWFTGGMILMLALPGTKVLIIMATLSTAALPYPVFSILYQKFRIRKWCPLCLSVQVVLIGEFILLLGNVDFTVLKLNDLIFPLIVFFAMFLIEVLLKLNLIHRKEKDHLRLEFLKIKRDPEIFLNKIKSGRKIIIHSKESFLEFGNPECKVTITIFLGLLCSSCGKKFPDILNFIKTNKRVRIQLVFYPSKDELNLKMFEIIGSMAVSGFLIDILEMLEKWYNSDLPTRIKLIDPFDFKNKKSHVAEIVNNSSSYFESANVTTVPSIFVNGYLLPEIFKLNDIKYNIEEVEKLE